MFGAHSVQCSLHKLTDDDFTSLTFCFKHLSLVTIYTINIKHYSTAADTSNVQSRTAPND